MDFNVNRKHKDSVFSALFGTPENLRDLYSAIEGIDIPSDAIVNINTLSDALYMKQINDLSFTINDRLIVLVEHQSTVTDNIPVRLLMYIARVYEKIIERDKLYQKKLEKIPTPRFIVLYNGKEPYPDHRELRLSAAFKDITELTLPHNDIYPLELIVQVYNINHGRNPEMLKRCENLNGYSIFIEKIMEYNEYLSLEDSVTNAVKYCLEQNVLKKFLEEHGTEVKNMLFDDISIEEIAAIRYNEGREQGREESYRVIAQNLLSKGSTPGFVQEITGLSIDEISAFTGK
ncbi:MAG: Rpn family recombination-promoting nuclease/putative transposase [Treponema sp.]|nr:Rpn family recombination-promoting nuclease/putative transposase [Treponema sp.]